MPQRRDSAFRRLRAGRQALWGSSSQPVLNSAARLITDTLSAARGLAIAQRRSHYVEYDDETTENTEKNRIRIFYIVTGRSIGTYTDRRTVGEWKYLPELIMFMDSDVNMPSGVIYRKLPVSKHVQFKANGGASGGSTGFTIIDESTYEGDLTANPRFVDTGLLVKAKTCNVTVINVTGRVRATFE